MVAATPAIAAPPAPLDPQNWSFQDNLTWGDYKQLPGPNYTDPAIQPTVKKWRVALIMVDYPGPAFTITQPAGSTVFGTPSAAAHSVPREQVPQFYADFLNKPSALNNDQTINRYWMEDSFGKYGVELLPYGPYRLPQRVPVPHLGLDVIDADAGLPEPAVRRHATRTTLTPCAMRGSAAPAAPSARRSTTRTTSPPARTEATWQEFGEMRFTGQDAVTDAFGPKAINPLHARGNWALTRYIPWTSWAAATNIWPSAPGTARPRPSPPAWPCSRTSSPTTWACRTTTTTRSPPPSSAPPAACGT